MDICPECHSEDYNLQRNYDGTLFCDICGWHEDNYLTKQQFINLIDNSFKAWAVDRKRTPQDWANTVLEWVHDVKITPVNKGAK